MRTYTLGDIKTDYGGTLSQPSLRLTPASIPEVIKSRLNFIGSQIQSVVVPILLGPRRHPVRVLVQNVQSFFSDVLMPLTLEKSMELQRGMFNKDLRLILGNVLTYLASRHFLNTVYVRGILTRTVSPAYEGAKVSFDEFMRISLLGQKEFLETDAGHCHPGSSVNMFRTVQTTKGSECFLLFHTLTYLVTHFQRKVAITCGRLTAILLALAVEEDTITRTLRFMLHTGLVESPQGTRLLLDHIIMPTWKAWFYVHRLAKYLTYIDVIKEDTPLDFRYRHGEMGFNQDRSFFFLKFIDWVRRVEISEVHNLDADTEAHYCVLCGSSPICLKLVKSYVLRVAELLTKNRIDKDDLTDTIKPTRALLSQIGADIRQDRLLLRGDREYLLRIRKDIGSMEKLIL